MSGTTDGEVERIARSRRGLFTATDLRRAGASEEFVRHRLRTGRWWQVYPGVFALLGVELTPVVAIHASVLAAGEDVVASHGTAAAVIGIPGYSRTAKPFHVTAPSYTARRRTPARVHGTLALPAHHRRVIAGVPTTSVARSASGWEVIRFSWEMVTRRPEAVGDSLRYLFGREVAA